MIISTFKRPVSIYKSANSTETIIEDTPVPLCEDYDIGGPNCPTYTGTNAVYRFSFAMVLFYFTFMLLSLGVSTSKTFRARLHNG
jgi:hypothetical protein